MSIGHLGEREAEGMRPFAFPVNQGLGSVDLDLLHFGPSQSFLSLTQTLPAQAELAKFERFAGFAGFLGLGQEKRERLVADDLTEFCQSWERIVETQPPA